MEIQDIQNYLRETPGNTNPAIVGSMIRELNTGSGLPDPTNLNNGTAIIAVDGQWKTSKGHGYVADPLFESIEYDNDPTGRVIVDLYEGTESPFLKRVAVKVSDKILSYQELNNEKNIIGIIEADGVEYKYTFLDTFGTEEVYEIGDGVGFYHWIFSVKAGTYNVNVYDGEYQEISFPEDGTYFSTEIWESLDEENVVDYLAAAQGEIYPIDGKMMPQGYGYYGDKLFKPIEWDGNIEGLAPSIEGFGDYNFYKISNNYISAEDIIGAQYITSWNKEQPTVINSEIITKFAENAYSVNNEIIIAEEDITIFLDDYIFIPKGIHSVYYTVREPSVFQIYVTSLFTEELAATPFDKKLIPSNDFIVNINYDENIGRYKADKTLGEIRLAEENKNVIGLLTDRYSDKIESCNFYDGADFPVFTKFNLFFVSGNLNISGFQLQNEGDLEESIEWDYVKKSGEIAFEPIEPIGPN